METTSTPETRTVEALCGHPVEVPASAKPGGSCERAARGRPCPAPRCQTGLPGKFTDAECDAYHRLTSKVIGDRRFPWTAFLVDMVDKSVFANSRHGRSTRFPDLVSFARHVGLL